MAKAEYGACLFNLCKVLLFTISSVFMFRVCVYLCILSNKKVASCSFQVLILYKIGSNRVKLRFQLVTENEFFRFELPMIE